MKKCLLLCIAAAVSAPVLSQVSTDTVYGNLIQFDDNGAWSWFQDERAVVDMANNALWVGSIANRSGVDGGTVDGHVQATRFDLNTGLRRTDVLGTIKSYGAGDDHNLPGFLVKEDGDILAFYAGHNNITGIGEVYKSFYRTYDNTTQTWSNQSEYDWQSVIPANARGAGGTTYSNLFQLSSEDSDNDGNGRIYNIARTQQSPHLIYSDDGGATWEYGGQLTKQNATPPATSYVNGYYKYSTNGTDRIDIIATEYHPRDYNNSLYHAYIQGGKLYNSDGVEIDSDIYSAKNSFDAATVTSTDDFTNVFQSGTTHNTRVWNTDVQNYDDGSIGVLFKARDGAFDTNHTVGKDNHNVWYARFDGTTKSWSTHEIAQAGANLFGSFESDYTGLGALDPNDPNTIYISTEINPIDNQTTDRHEIYKGVTSDSGQTWTWEAITENSTYDNLRPIIPKWTEGNTALIWWRGDMSSSQSYDTSVTGLVLRKDEVVSKVQYIDASLANTVRADGVAFNPTVANSSGDQGDNDNNWHVRTGFANNSNVFAASEKSGIEDAPLLKTSVANMDAGIYDVFAYFWTDFDATATNPGDWRILGGLSEDELIRYRDRGSQQAVDSEFADGLVILTDESNRSLYRAYIGRVNLEQGETLEVFIDDDATADSRIWYDGIGFAEVAEVPEPTSLTILILTGSELLSRRRR